MNPISLLPAEELVPPPKAKTMVYVIKDKATLYALYMPFLKTGGLFIPAPQNHPPGTKMLILLTIPDDPNKKTVSGKVCWLTPLNAGLGMNQGVGILFDDNEQNRTLKIQIENLLAGILGRTETRTQTL